MYEKTEIPLKQIQLTKGGRRIMKPKAFIYGEPPHRELSIHDVPLWSFNDQDNVHEIENWRQMAEEIVATRGSLNNHLVYLQGDYPRIINDASKIKPVAKVSCIKYNEETKTFVADITSTYQPFIDMIAATEYFPRVHPCYEAETHQVNIQTISSTFKRLLCWLVEPIKNKTKLSIEYHPEGRSDESENGNNDIINKTPHNRRRDEMPLTKDDVYNVILKNIQPVLNDPFSDDGKRKWTYESYVKSFNWQIHTPKAILQIGASLVFDIENKCWVWEIHTRDTSNVNVKIYADRVVLRDESCSNYDDFSIDFMRKIRDDLAERLDEYNRKYRKYRSKFKSDADNEKANRWETMRTGINTTLNSFCDKIISNSVVGGSYEKSGSLRRITLGEKTIDIILEFDTDLDRWDIFIGDPTKPRIFVSINGYIAEDISVLIPDPLCHRDIQTLCDMLVACKDKNWQAKEDTHEERMKSCEASDDEEDISNLIPKEELMKIISENVESIPGYIILAHVNENDVRFDDSFIYIVYDRQKHIDNLIGCNLNKDHWEIYTDEDYNVNIVVYPDEARWMTDDILMRNPCKDFPTGIFESIIEDINTWIKTKTMPNKEQELPAFSQRLIKDGKRPTKDEYYLAMAEVASISGTCIRRRFGAVIVKNNKIVSTGYVGAPSGRDHCSEIGYCFREHHKIPSGTMYEKCRSTHAEMNAIIQASKEEMEGATLYLVGVEPDGRYTNSDCCALCKRVIINSGIEKVVAKQKNGMYNIIPVKEWIEHDDSLDINHKGY